MWRERGGSLLFAFFALGHHAGIRSDVPTYVPADLPTVVPADLPTVVSAYVPAYVPAYVSAYVSAVIPAYVSGVVITGGGGGAPFFWERSRQSGIWELFLWEKRINLDCQRHHG